MNKDSLTLAKDLREAGFDAEQSAALAHCFAGLPTREELHSTVRDSEDRLRHDIRVQGKETAAQIVVLEGKIDVLGKEMASLRREMASLVGEMRMQRYGLFGIYAVIVALLAPLAINTLINGGL